MKKLYLNLVFGVLFNIGSLVANHSTSELNIRMFDHSPITIELDRQVFYQPRGKFHVGDLQPGRHFLKVVQHRVMNHYPFRSYPVVVFCGYIQIQPHAEVFAMIDRFNRYAVIRVVDLLPPPVCSYGCTGACAHQHFDYGDDYGHEHHWWNSACHFNHMNDYDFSMLRQSIADRDFESTKRQVAMQAVLNNHFSARQVKELMMLFTFESTKLDVAKLAYEYTCDKGNFFVVNDAFTFNSSIDELNRFIVMR